MFLKIGAKNCIFYCAFNIELKSNYLPSIPNISSGKNGNRCDLIPILSNNNELCDAKDRLEEEEVINYDSFIWNVSNRPFVHKLNPQFTSCYSCSTGIV